MLGSGKRRRKTIPSMGELHKQIGGTVKDTIREQWLSNHGYTWEYHDTVVLNDIRIDEGVRRQIRLSNTVDEDHVARLVMALTDGAQLPAVILAKVEGKIELVDGVHRLSALKHKNFPTTDAYELTNVKDRTQLEQARRITNAPVGKGFSTEEAVQQAVALVTRSNWAPKEAAKALSVSTEGVTRRLRVVATDERLAKLRPKADLTGLSVATRDYLGRIQNDDVLGESLDTVIDRKMPVAMVEEVFKDALTLSSDADIERFRTKLRSAYPMERRPRFPDITRTPEWNVDRAVIQLKRAITGLDNRASYLNQLEESKRKAVANELQQIGADLLTRATNLSVNGGTVDTGRSRQTRQPGRSQKAGGQVRRAGKSRAGVS